MPVSVSDKTHNDGKVMGLKGLCICVRISSVFKRKADEWHKRMMCSLGYFIQSDVHTYKIKIMSLQFYQLLSFF